MVNYGYFIYENFLILRKIPEPFASTWMQLVAEEKAEKSALNGPGKGKKGNNTTSSQNTVEKEEITSSQISSEKSCTPNLNNISPKVEDFSEFEPVGKSEIHPETVSSEDYIAKNKEIYKKKNTEESEKILDRLTADWMCDNCNAQNFAKLLSGVQRVKCFKCQSVRGTSCSLVLSVAEVRTRTAQRTYDSFFFKLSFFIFVSIIMILQTFVWHFRVFEWGN